MPYPEEFLYTKDHEWIRVDGDTGSVGVTDHAQKELGDIVFVELPHAGAHVSAKESLGTVESVKAVADVYSPVTGEVVAVNPKIQQAPELVNTDPHGEGWLVKIKLKDRSETDSLMTAEEYEAFVASGAAH
ncbi:MAG TPA: glycine cleavage system protein GcvH [Terriglobia bacterium]|nr:glycine cleavage system protein GcvH [Terriglobia bacterium]HEV2500802.1 glycine cleavage system protein GcvH [Terriglobia bacterium]